MGGVYTPAVEPRRLNVRGQEIETESDVTMPAGVKIEGQLKWREGTVDNV